MPKVNEMEVPKAPSNYTKLEEDGTVKLRILSTDFIEWYSDYDASSKKSIKYKKDECPEQPINPDWLIYFRACIVRNYDENMVQIREIKSKQIMNGIKTLMNDADRGENLDYDLKVTKKGVKKDTKYSVVPAWKWPVSKEIMKIYKDADLQLESILENLDPFKK